MISGVFVLMRVYNLRDPYVPADAVYIGRPSKRGNPFVIGRHGTREEVIARYREMLLRSPVLLAAARKELAGRDVACFCAPKACHGDVFVELVNDEEL